ncbi:MAG: hypothetical protein ACM3NN_15160, partial [Nitrospirota bacterium]
GREGRTGEKDGPSGGGSQRHGSVIEMTFTAGGSQGSPAFSFDFPSIVKHVRHIVRRPEETLHIALKSYCTLNGRR